MNDYVPYGYLEIGTEESNQRISRSDLLRFWESEYVPQHAALIVSGDVTPSEVRVLAARYFGNWTGNVLEHSQLNKSDAVRRSIFIVDKPGAPQTQVRVAALGTSRSSPDYVPLEVMNMVFGGVFSSRLNMNLRERHGYAYGASSNFVFRRDGGYFASGGGIRTDVTAPAVKEIFAEIEDMRSQPVSSRELTLGKNSFSLTLPALFETSSRIADTLSYLFVYGLPLDYTQSAAEN